MIGIASTGPKAAHGVPVPVEFDTVTNLGPATKVYLHTGLRLPHFGPPRPNVLVLYSDGLAYQTGKDVHTWRWDEIATIQSNVWYTDSSHVVSENHEYGLLKASGETIILDDQVKGVYAAVQSIKHIVYKRLAPPLTQAYNAGQALTFGPVGVQKQSGLQLNGQHCAWKSILEIKTDRGRFTVTLRDSKKHEVRVSAIPNMELLARLLDLNYTENAYF